MCVCIYVSVCGGERECVREFVFVSVVVFVRVCIKNAAMEASGATLSFTLKGTSHLRQHSPTFWVPRI